MGNEGRTLHIFFFPFLAHGHMIPMVEMAKLFASKGVKATIVTTPLNASFISKAIGKAKTHDYEIHIQTIELPCEEAGLPNGCESLDSLPSKDLFLPFFDAVRLLQKPLEQLILEHHPGCIVADLFFPWTTDLAAKFRIPRLIFHGTSCFSLCALNCTARYQPYKNVSSDSEPFVLPAFPGEIKMTRMQLPDIFMSDESNKLSKMMEEGREAEAKSFGVVVNSFYELEQDYADYYRKVLGRKAWHIGPMVLCNKDLEEKAYRGKDASIDEHECLKWLDTKKPNSVIYVCFGSGTQFPNSQLRDIAVGLEASEQQFVWVVKKSKKDGEDRDDWLPDEGFEKRMEGKGLIIRGWAPQVLVLEHEAIGAFVTHCGWNSTLEGVAAGVPMVTWPIGAEQFFNEMLVIQVLKTGVSVGAKKRRGVVGDSDIVKWDVVEKVLRRIMEGEEAEDLRNKAKMLAQTARVAMEEGGSSYSGLNALIEELCSTLDLGISL